MKNNNKTIKGVKIYIKLVLYECELKQINGIYKKCRKKWGQKTSKYEIFVTTKKKEA